MYMHGLKLFTCGSGSCNCGCSGCKGGLSGLAGKEGDQLLTTAGEAFLSYETGGATGGIMGSGGGGSGGSSSANTNVNTVSTNVSTQVSPQISPNFIQQQQPTNSAVNAATSANPVQNPGGIPTVPMTGMIPGIDGTPPSYPVLAQAPHSMFNKETLIYGALGAVAVALVVKYAKRKKAA